MLLAFYNTYTNDANNKVGVSHLLLLTGSIHGRLRLCLRPGTMGGVGVSKGTISRRIVHTAGVCVVICLVVITTSVFVVDFSRFSLMAGFATMIAALGGINPNLSLVNPAKGFKVFSPLSGLILSFSVLTNQLRLFPVLVLFLHRA